MLHVIRTRLAPRVPFSARQVPLWRGGAISRIQRVGYSTEGPGNDPERGSSAPHFVAVLAVASIALAGYYQISYVKRGNEAQKTKQQKPDEKAIPSTPRGKVADMQKLDSNEITVVFVLGGPGSGKGTNCEQLVRDYGFTHLSAGDLLREEQNRPNSEYGDLIRYYIREGLIVPKEVTIALLRNAILRNAESKRFLIDGFPRAMDQALEFEEKVIEGAGVLYFECPEEEMLARLMVRGKTSGRADDNAESIQKRFRTFRDTSFPVIEHYMKLNKVFSVSCQGPPEEVYARTKQIVDGLVARK